MTPEERNLLLRMAELLDWVAFCVDSRTTKDARERLCEAACAVDPDAFED